MKDREMLPEPLLKRPKYIVWGEDGRLAELYCKLCGAQIGGQQSRLIGKEMNEGRLVHNHVLEFQRYPQYMEAKIEFEDGSFHVTLGCDTCLQRPLRPEVLDALHHADQDVYPSAISDFYKTRKAKRVMGVKRGGGIL